MIEAERRGVCALAVLCCAVVLGCATDGPVERESSTTTTTMSTTSTTIDTTTTTTTTSNATTDTNTDTASDTTSDTTGAAPQLCGIDDLAPGAANPIEASDRLPMQLPVEIGEILARSCGCHFADDLLVAGDYPASGTLDLTSWSAWHADFNGSPTYEAARSRLDPAVEIILMPPRTCDVGGGETMRPDDRARLLEWIDALAPDGPTWSDM